MHARKADLRQYQETNASKPGQIITPQHGNVPHPSERPLLVMTDNEMRQTARILPVAGETAADTDSRMW